MIYDMAESMLSGNDALKNYLIKLYKDDYYNNDSEPSERDLLELLTTEIENRI
jgi:hypothetical protein